MLNLDNNTLNTLSYFKSIIIKDCKDLDIDKSGSIPKEDALSALKSMKN